MELRIQAARTTRDIDLAIRQLPGGVRQWDEAAIRNLLENAAGIDLEDSFEFFIGEPTMDLDAAPYGGSRYPVEARMAGRRFAQFHLDVSAGDVLREPYETLEGRDWLGFAELPRAKVSAVSREEQFAEKLHAYTLPRQGRPNTRVKDLLDLVLLSVSGTLDAARVRESVAATFHRRATHPVPATLPPPPEAWRESFAELASECGMAPEIEAHFAQVAGFLALVLA